MTVREIQCGIDIGEIVPSTALSGLEGMQLMPAGDKLALLTPPTPDLYRLDQPDQYRLFLINPSSGSVSYSGVFDVVPEPDVSTLAAVSTLLVRRRRSNR